MEKNGKRMRYELVIPHIFGLILDVSTGPSVYACLGQRLIDTEIMIERQLVICDVSGRRCCNDGSQLYDYA